MSFQEVVFYVLSAIVLYSGLRVVTAKNPVHAALFLVLAFFSAAGHWLLMQAEFLAIALVLVYVGAVMVLFLFVVMMLDINFEKLHEGFWRPAPGRNRCSDYGRRNGDGAAEPIGRFVEHE